MDNTKIHVVSDEAYNRMISNLRNRVHRMLNVNVSTITAGEIVDAILADANAINPHAVPDYDTCTAMLATNDGWQQCSDDRGHDGGHDSIDWAWDDIDPNAVPARKV